MNNLVTRMAARRFLTTTTRTMQSHALPSLPTRKAARADWSGEGKRLGRQAAIFFPGITVLLGWPFFAKTVFDGHV